MNESSQGITNASTIHTQGLPILRNDLCCRSHSGHDDSTAYADVEKFRQRNLLRVNQLMQGGISWEYCSVVSEVILHFVLNY